MASSSSSFVSIFSMLVSLAFLFLFFVAPSIAEKHTKLKIICSKTFNRQWCLKLLKNNDSYAGAGDESNYNLTKLAIGLAYSKAEDVHKDLNSLSDGTGNSTLKDRYNSCSKNYHDAMRDLEVTKRLFKDRDYKRITVQVNDAVEEIRDCKNRLEKSDTDSSDLKKKNKEFELLCDIVKVASRHLRDESS